MEEGKRKRQELDAAKDELERAQVEHQAAALRAHLHVGEPCPVCGTAVQRIRYAENETNYCPRCQTGGKLLADRALSRLLKDDWPRTIEALENSKRGQERR